MAQTYTVMVKVFYLFIYFCIIGKRAGTSSSGVLGFLKEKKSNMWMCHTAQLRPFTRLSKCQVIPVSEALACVSFRAPTDSYRRDRNPQPPIGYHLLGADWTARRWAPASSSTSSSSSSTTAASLLVCASTPPVCPVRM